MLKYLYLFFLSFLLLSFSGCSLKSVEAPQEVVTTQESSPSDEEDETDDFLEEFADEEDEEEVYDPLNGYNRVMTNFNDKLFEYLLIPVAKGYKLVLHQEVRRSIENFFQNLYYPSRLVNNLLQGKFVYASEETGRFLINSTVGILGLFDPAKSQLNLKAHPEDLGQTLGFYGVGSGPHIVWPFLGPSNLRDSLALYPDALLNPIDYAPRSWYTLTDTFEEFLALKSLERVNKTSFDIHEYETIKKDAIDLYPYLRDLYEQYRDRQIQE